jgi:hypothetical protein
VLGFDQEAEEALRRDCDTIRIRPDFAPWWSFEGSLFERVDRAGHIGQLRCDIIELCGAYEIQHAVPALRAITKDAWEWSPYTKDVANKTLRLLEK